MAQLVVEPSFGLEQHGPTISVSDIWFRTVWSVYMSFDLEQHGPTN